MPKVTIGVPVYNAASMLRECLECIRQQTYADFCVLIFDNCSNDETQTIALQYVAMDARFSYHRQDTNIGAWANFAALLDACKTDYFLWRAYDDYTDLNYIEELVNRLDEAPDADLAVGSISTSKTGRKNKLRISRAPTSAGRGSFAAYRFVKRARAAWIYGMWRTAAIQARWKELTPYYSHPWGGDFMLMFPTLYRGRVVGSAKTTFYQRVRQHEWKTQDGEVSTRAAAGVRYRVDASAFLNAKAAELSSTLIERLLYKYLANWFVNHRIYAKRKARQP